MIRAFLERDPARGQWHFYLSDIDPQTRKQTHRGAPVVLEPVDQEGSYSPPTMTLSQEEVKALMDDMWMAGIRPSSTSSAVDLVEAKDQHLADLRKSHDAIITVMLREIK